MEVTGADRPAAVVNRFESLYQLHIPKTAGMMLHAALSDHFAPPNVCPVLLDSRAHQDGLGRIQPTEFAHPRFLLRRWQRAVANADGLGSHLGRYRLVAGHDSIDVGAHLRQPVMHVTMLRDPSARVVSLVRHIARNPIHPLHSAAARGPETFVAAALDSDRYADRQCRQIVGRAADGVTDPVELAAMAIALLRRDDVCFGLTERFDTSLELIGRRLGLDLSNRMNQRLNAAPGQVSATPNEAVAEILAPVNRADELFYAEAATIFDGLVNRHPPMNACLVADSVTTHRLRRPLDGTIASMSKLRLSPVVVGRRRMNRS